MTTTTDQNHSERGHAINGPSSLSRRIACPGSREAEEGLPDTTSGAAEEGTRAHELLERILRGQNPTGNERPEMMAAVMEAVRWVHARVELGYSLYVEEKVNPEPILGAETWGTADIILVNEESGHVIVADFKYGKGHVVEAKANPQLLSYAAGVICSSMVLDHMYSFTLTIIQPRARSGATIKSVKYSWEEILELWNDISAAVDLTFTQDAPRRPDIDTCHFCKARKECPERLRAALDATNEAFAKTGTVLPEEIPCPDTINSVLKVSDMSDESLSALYDTKALVMSVYDDIENEVFTRIKSGKRVPGYKIIQGRGNRKWALDEDTLRKKFKSMKLTLSDVELVKLKSPAQIEKLDKLTAKQKTNLSGMWTTPEGVMKLVVESAAGKALIFNSDEAFTESQEEVTPPLSFL